MARILLADDDFALRDFIRRALEADGHDVVAVHDGGDALERLTSPLDSFDLLLTDIRMPVLDGVALARHLARVEPVLPVLLMTGYAEHRTPPAGLEGRVRGVVVKPFTLEQIREHVRAALGAEAA